jgi:hypothetical protein
MSVEPIATIQKKGKQNKSGETSMKTNNAVSKMFTLLLTAVALGFTAHSASAIGSVPFAGSAEGTTVSASPVTGGLLLVVEAEGDATQLGQFSREETILFNPATGSLTGVITFTAANGDQLFGTVEGGFISAGAATGTYTFTGGTGRFENASGEADFFLSTSDGVSFTVEFEGSLSSVGTNKK